MTDFFFKKKNQNKDYNKYIEFLKCETTISLLLPPIRKRKAEYENDSEEEPLICKRKRTLSTSEPLM